MFLLLLSFRFIYDVHSLLSVSVSVLARSSVRQGVSIVVVVVVVVVAPAPVVLLWLLMVALVTFYGIYYRRRGSAQVYEFISSVSPLPPFSWRAAASRTRLFIVLFSAAPTRTRTGAAAQSNRSAT